MRKEEATDREPRRNEIEKDIELDTYELLEENNDLLRENRRLLKAMHRQQKWQQFSKFIYWVIIIGVVVGAFAFLRPYIERLTNAYQNVVNTVDRVNEVRENVEDNVGGVFNLFNRNNDTDEPAEDEE